MEIKNKFNIDDIVYVYDKGLIIRCNVRCIEIKVRPDKVQIVYELNGVDKYGDDMLNYHQWEEEEISSSIQDIINHIEVI